ncbi:MAG: 3-hydroxy-9,10-secoandrosta,3,5(10)-triene-9,17-dione monooxygenase, partial [Actinomycetota bacterium]|nr:3-hydroxy-9,10-secoandrosta,3,5(10)-triene-9,17-dione monooxygenase [Actinomycetota bacterium]
MIDERTAADLRTGRATTWLSSEPPEPPALDRFLVGLRDARDEIEAGRSLPDSVVRGLVDAGLARLCVPRRLGGDQADPVALARCLEAVARADASTAWCAWIYASAPWFLAYATPAAIEAVYGDGPDALVASPLAPTGRATTVDGGVRVSGRWPFASGSRHCDWFLCRVVLDGGPGQRLVLMPTYEVARLDNWWPNGLSGTGSGDVAVDDVFVPRERV